MRHPGRFLRHPGRFSEDCNAIPKNRPRIWYNRLERIRVYKFSLKSAIIAENLNFGQEGVLFSMSDNIGEHEINTKEFLEKVEEAARNGAMQGSKGRGGRRFSLYDILKTGILLVMIGAFVMMFLKIQSFTGSLKSLVQRDAPVEDRDLTLENHGILGYTAADFQDAILGDSEQLKKLEVYTINVSDVATLVDTGIGNIKAFTKTQLITYKGTATYTVDLGELSRDDITLDESELTVRIKIPHAVCEPININENDIEFGDVDKGLLAIGDINITPEQMSEVQGTARDKMEKKLEEQKTAEEADRFAKMSVWEIYQPIINAVTSGYSLEVEFD